MRKVFIALASCLALVAFTGLSAPAFGVTKIDPSCDQDNPDWGDGIPGPYDNTFALHDFTIVTGSPFARQVSRATGSGLACGTEIEGGLVGVETLNDNARIKTAPGVEVNETGTASIPDTSYAGNGTIHAASWTGLTQSTTIPLIVPQQFTLRTDAISECERENGLLEGGPEDAAPIIACYKGTTSGRIPGHNWNFVVPTAVGATLVIAPFYNDMPQHWPAGLTSIDEFNLCAYAGATGDHGTEGTCGDGSDPSKWLQKNGDWSVFPPPATVDRHGDGYGRYTATVTNKAGEVTDPLSTDVDWWPQLQLAGSVLAP